MMIALLAKYDAACRALATTMKVNEVLSLRAEMEHVKLYGRQVKDRCLMAEATEWQTRAERRLGELLLEAERLGWIGRGRPKENVPGSEHFTLEEAGIDRKLSSRTQRLATMPTEHFEGAIAEVKERIISGEATFINGARAVMASRQESSDSLDYFPTPPWATRALMERVMPALGYPRLRSVWEPACGEGHMAEVLAEYADSVIATDIHDYGYGARQNFLIDAPIKSDWIITNPPFGDQSEQFVLRSLLLATVGVAMFVRLQWLETTGRYENIFHLYPPTLIAFFAERVNLCKGRWDPDGSTATAYIWLIWIHGHNPRAPIWIAPGCRESLTHTDDRVRFTVSPVKRIHSCIVESESANASASPPTGAALDIPVFLRREPAEVVVP